MLRPRRLLHRGSVEAAGFLFDVRLLGEREARRRLLACWQTGAQVFRLPEQYVLRLGSPLRVDASRAPGAVLLSVKDFLTTIPLEAEELDGLFYPANSVVQLRGGRVLCEPLTSEQLEDPAAWLDLQDFQLAPVQTLGMIYERPRTVAEPVSFDPRSRLKGVPPPAPELLERLAELKTMQGGRNASATEGTLRGRAARGKSLSNFFGALGDLLRGMFHSGRRAASGDEALQQTAFESQGQAASHAGKPNLGQRWRQLLGRLMQTTHLSNVIGRRQAGYLVRMMQMFERGDIDEALRHAISLSDLPPSLNSTPAFSVPRPRQDLSIQPWRAPASSAISLGEDLMSHLRQLYRATFERLAAQGRYEEAAFVLAELLRDSAEAVAFLERHGKLRLAAELAEARELLPALVVRQWFLAGEVERAVRIARSTQSFAGAVVRLEKTDPRKAEEFRLMWAETLAASGDYAAACEVLWTVEAYRPRVSAWLNAAIELGGTVAARMLARKLSQFPEEFAETKERALALLEDESYEQRDARLMFAETLAQGTSNPQTQVLARAAARALLRDAGREPHPMQPKQFRQLLDFARDHALRTDMPQFPRLTEQSVERAGADARYEFSAFDRGASVLFDAALLPDGRLLVALGEAGVKLLTRDGRTITHFDQPAHRLVLSDHGDRALLLAPRGAVWRLSRLDLVVRRAMDWCDAQLEAFAPDFDGSLWFVGMKGDFYAVDATAKGLDALWRVPEVGGRVLDVARTADACRFLTGIGSGLELWDYTLPLLTLRRRSTIDIAPASAVRLEPHLMLAAHGWLADLSFYGAPPFSPPPDEKAYPKAATSEALVKVERLPELRLRLWKDEQLKHDFLVGTESSSPGQPEVRGQHALSLVYEEGGAYARLFDLQTGRLAAWFFLAGSRRARTRLREQTLTLADDCGRVVVYDLERRHLLRNLRV